MFVNKTKKNITITKINTNKISSTNARVNRRVHFLPFIVRCDLNSPIKCYEFIFRTIADFFVFKADSCEIKCNNHIIFFNEIISVMTKFYCVCR